jgi:hypothetical protein
MGNLELIVTNSKPYGIIKGTLRKWKKTGIISCNSCARACETGGKEKMEELAERLKKDGFNVVDTHLVPMTCNLDLAKKPEYDCDEMVILACDSGVATYQMLFPEKKIIPGLNTIGIGARDGDGNIFLMKQI